MTIGRELDNGPSYSEFKTWIENDSFFRKWSFTFVPNIHLRLDIITKFCFQQIMYYSNSFFGNKTTFTLIIKGLCHVWLTKTPSNNIEEWQLLITWFITFISKQRVCDARRKREEHGVPYCLSNDFFFVL